MGSLCATTVMDSAVASLTALTLAACGGRTVPVEPLPNSNISGVYDGVVTNFDGRGDAHVGFSFDQKTGTPIGSVRILPPLQSPWKQHRYKAHDSIDAFEWTASGAQIAGHVAFGSDFGTFAFYGTIVNGTFTFSYKDAVASGTGSAKWEAPYTEPGTTVSLKAAQAPAYTGTYTVDLGTLNVINPISQETCFPVNPNGVSTFPMTVTSAKPDGYGGISLTGLYGGPLSYVGGSPPYAFSDEGGQIADVWGVITTIGQVYTPVSNPGTYVFFLTIVNWNPPAANTSGTWNFNVTTPSGPSCAGAGALDSITSS